MTEATDDLRLEREPCYRCGGTGHYSYCQMYGTRCFGCEGKGEVLTKRGAVANEFLKQLRSKLVSEIVVGDVIFDSFFGKAKVLKVEPIGDGQFSIETTKVHFANKKGDEKCRMAWPKEKLVETMKQAIEFQNSLTKDGKPRKK